MAIPDNWTLVPVRGTFLYTDGTPLAGKVIKFKPRVPRLVNPSVRETFIALEVSATLDGDGHFEVSLPAGDDPDVTPSDGWTYLVTEEWPGGSSYEIQVPLAAETDGVDLSLVAPVPPNTGTPSAVVTRLEFDSVAARVNTLAAPVIVPEGGLVPAGTKAGTVVYRSPVPPQAVKVTHVSNNKSEDIDAFELPDDLAVGDVVLAVASTRGAGRSYVWAAPWEEVFDFTQSRTTSAAIYRITDQAALDAITKPVITPTGNFDEMVLATIKLTAPTETWPAYSSGNGRSGNSLSTATETTITTGAISSSPFTAYGDEFCFAAAYSGMPGGPAPTLVLPDGFSTVVDATTGGFAFVMGRRTAGALPLAGVTFSVAQVPGHVDTGYGAAHFIIPA